MLRSITEKIASLESELAEVEAKLAASKPFSVRAQMRDTRKFAEERLKNLAGLLNKEPRAAREAIAKHVKKITLTQEGAHYVATGTYDLLGFLHRRITWCRGGIGPNVCLFTSSGWRRPDPCCYESHQKLKRLPRSRPPNVVAFRRGAPRPQPTQWLPQ